MLAQLSVFIVVALVVTMKEAAAANTSMVKSQIMDGSFKQNK